MVRPQPKQNINMARITEMTESYINDYDVDDKDNGVYLVEGIMEEVYGKTIYPYLNSLP